MTDYALYQWTNKVNNKTYLGIYKYSPEREYIASTEVKEFWEDYHNGLLERKIILIDDEAVIRFLESAVLASAKEAGLEHTYYNLSFGFGPQGTVDTPQSRERKSKAAKKQWQSQEYRDFRTRIHTGLGNPTARPANIYDNKTGVLIAGPVAIYTWARENGYGSSGLSKTAHTDRSKPSSGKNPHHHKGIYARYI